MPKRRKFLDLKTNKSFSTGKYIIVRKKVNGTIKKFAVAKAPSGYEANLIIK